MKFRHAAALLATALASLPAYGAVLTGSQVQGTLTAFSATNFSVAQQFASPATVGAGVEFTGAVFDASFSNTYNIAVDLSDTAAIIRITSPNPNANISWPVPEWQLQLTSLAGLFPAVASIDFACGPSCSHGSGLAGGFPTASASGITVAFGRTYAGDTYTLNFAAEPAVPEPATWAMMIAGFGLVGGALRRHSIRTSIACA
jgi:hypothetical protein